MSEDLNGPFWAKNAVFFASNSFAHSARGPECMTERTKVPHVLFVHFRKNAATSFWLLPDPTLQDNKFSPSYCGVVSSKKEGMESSNFFCGRERSWFLLPTLVVSSAVLGKKKTWGNF